MTQVFYASTLFSAMSLSAAIDAGLFGERTQRRQLIVSSNVPVPELAPGFEATPAFAVLRHRFDDIVSWNDVIAPMHPSHWLPPDAELPMLSRLITDRLELGDGVSELVADSIAVAPSATIASLLRDCPITVYSDGLMSYGPTRDATRPGVGRRIGRLLYLDLVSSVTPLLLREEEVTPVALPASAFTDVVAELPAPDVGEAAGCPVIIGQYLSQLGIVSAADEIDLHLRMLRALAARGERRVVFRPHPSAARAHIAPLRASAADLGVELVVPGDGLPAEAWFAAARPSLVVSCFSTALFTAARYYGLAVAGLGTDVVLDRLTPYANSNRIPAVIVDATLPRLQPDGSVADPPPVDRQRLVGAVGYYMQPDRLPELRSAAIEHLAAHGEQRYFKRRRLRALGLVATPAALVPANRVARLQLARARTSARRWRSRLLSPR